MSALRKRRPVRYTRPKGSPPCPDREDGKHWMVRSGDGCRECFTCGWSDTTGDTP